MTSGELKFAMIIEDALSSIAYDETRQLIVEGMVVLNRFVELMASRYPDVLSSHNWLSINMLELLASAQQDYCKYQLGAENSCIICKNINKGCGPYSICNKFYSLAPSGSGGTTTYIAKQFIKKLFS